MSSLLGDVPALTTKGKSGFSINSELAIQQDSVIDEAHEQDTGEEYARRTDGKLLAIGYQLSARVKPIVEQRLVLGIRSCIIL